MCAIAHPPAGHVVQRRYWSVSDERTVRVVTRSLSCQGDDESLLRIANTSQDAISISKILAVMRKCETIFVYAKNYSTQNRVQIPPTPTPAPQTPMFSRFIVLYQKANGAFAKANAPCKTLESGITSRERHRRPRSPSTSGIRRPCRRS